MEDLPGETKSIFPPEVALVDFLGQHLTNQPPGKHDCAVGFLRVPVVAAEHEAGLVGKDLDGFTESQLEVRRAEQEGPGEVEPNVAVDESQPEKVPGPGVGQVHEEKPGAGVTLDEPGPYKLVCIAELPDGRKLKNEVGVIVSEPEDMPPLVLRLEKDQYATGELLSGELHSRYEDARVPAECLLGNEGSAFAIAQTRLGGGRIHHAMRTVGQCQRAFDMMCERALSRETQGTRLSEKQSVQNDIADSWLELLQFRLLVLHTAWLIDRGAKQQARTQIAAVKVATPKILHDVVWRAMHLHGALGVSNEMPFGGMWLTAAIMSVVDGPSEVHRITIAKRVLRDYKPSEGLFPSEHLPTRLEAAQAKFAEILELEVGDL